MKMSKQETLEEVATKEGLYICSQNNFNQAEAGYNAKWFKRGALFGAKWQQENTNINALNFEICALKKEIKVLKHQQEQDKNKFSEEDMKQFAFECVANFLSNDDNKVEIALVDVILDRNSKNFKKFKNK
jgi:hypothetical protein